MASRDPTEPEIAALYQPVGELVLNWSVWDSMIVKIVALVFQSTGGKHQEPKIPFEFKRRIKFLRRCVNRIDALKPFAPEMAAILTNAKILSKIRDSIVHGALSKFDPETGRYEFVKLDILKNENIHEGNTLLITIENMREMAERCQAGYARSAAIALRLADTFL